MIQGLQWFQQGKAEHAVSQWHEAARLYAEANERLAQGRALMHLAEAYQALGQYTHASQHLHNALRLVEQDTDQTQKAAILASLGNVYTATGDVDEAERLLRQALYLARELDNARLLASILNNLENLLSTQEKPSWYEVLRVYQESAAAARQAEYPAMVARALTHAAMAATQTEHYGDIQALLDEAREYLREVAPTHDTVYDLINIGLSYDRLRHILTKADTNLLLVAAEVFTRATQLAESMGDVRALSYALGHLGHLYEAEHRYQEALQLTRRAVVAAQQVQAPESLYLWQWQAGRLLNALDDRAAALTAYERAIATVQSIRTAFPLRYGGPPTTFRETLGPLYLERVDLLLRRAAALEAQGQDASQDLQAARETVEWFKAAELRDYFRDECVDAAPTRTISIDQLSRTAVIVYPIPLPDRLELLVSLPEGLKRYQVPVEAQEFEGVAQSFRVALQERFHQLQKDQAAKLYTWLIRPLEADLRASHTQTLVVVPDGALRTIPLAALHDGQDFLISKYAVAVTPSLELTNPLPLMRDNLRLLALGISAPIAGFEALPGVAGEIKALQHHYEGFVLLNQDFTVAGVETAVRKEQFSIIHIASHAQFARDVKQSFLLAFDNKLTLDHLEKLIGRLQFRTRPVELLTLSACETAMGEDRAALGLAGVAIKAGARSALATLWRIRDEAASMLVAAFYRHLQDPSMSRARALQKAQQEMLLHPDYKDPFFWAPFLLINNWL
jgi:CHAT domain-containing protein